jgi:hypothetical protein
MNTVAPCVLCPIPAGMPRKPQSPPQPFRWTIYKLASKQTWGTQESVVAVNKNLSGHFAFMICPPAVAKAIAEISTNGPRFDRIAFHKQFNAGVLSFFRTELRPAHRE